MSEEVKHEKFRRIAEARTNKIINMIRLLGNCSNRVSYSYTDSEVKQIFDAIEKEVSSARDRFKDSSVRDKQFKLK